MSDAELERAILALAFETAVPLTAAAVAYHVGCRVEVARRELDALASHGALVLDSDDQGNLVYLLAGHARTPGAAPPPRHPLPSRPRRRWAYAANVVLPGAGTLAVGKPVVGAMQVALATLVATLLMAFWKDFGDAEHRPWLIVLGAVYVATLVWSMTSVRPPREEAARQSATLT